MKRIFFYIFLAALLIGLSPLIIAFSGVGIAALLGCEIGTTGPITCMVAGADLGPTLLTMVMMHWLGILGLPIAALGALGLLIIGIISLIQKLRG